MEKSQIVASLRKRPDTATDGKKLIINLFDEFFNNHDMSAVDRYMHPDYIQHDFDVTAFGYARGNICDRSQRKEPSVFAADVEIMDALENAACQALGAERVHRGLVVTGDQFIAERSVKNEIASWTEGYCTEMEGAAIAQAAWLNQIPFVIIRAISDKADGSAHMDYSEFEAKAIEHTVRLVEAAAAKLA